MAKLVRETSIFFARKTAWNSTQISLVFQRENSADFCAKKNLYTFFIDIMRCL